jgi:peptide deformylase
VSSLPIRVFGDPVLTEVAKEISDIDGKIVSLAELMIDVMYEAPGVGLAANQIGINKRIFVYDKGDGPVVVVNPVIKESSGEWTYEEGCLSVPGLSWDITRPNAIHLVGFGLDGEEISIETDEFEGRIFQHEMDHLNGILLVERLDDDQKKAAKKLLRKRAIEVSAADPDGLNRLFGS